MNDLSKSLNDLDKKYGPIYFTKENYVGVNETYGRKEFVLPGVWFNVRPASAYGIDFGEIQVKLCDYSIAYGRAYRCDVVGGRFYQRITDHDTHVLHPFIYNKYVKDTYSICLGTAETPVQFFNKSADFVGSADSIKDVFMNTKLSNEFLFPRLLRHHINTCPVCGCVPENVTYKKDGLRKEHCNRCQEQIKRDSLRSSQSL